MQEVVERRGWRNCWRWNRSTYVSYWMNQSKRSRAGRDGSELAAPERALPSRGGKRLSLAAMRSVAQAQPEGRGEEGWELGRRRSRRRKRREVTQTSAVKSGRP